MCHSLGTRPMQRPLVAGFGRYREIGTDDPMGSKRWLFDRTSDQSCIPSIGHVTAAHGTLQRTRFCCSADGVGQYRPKLLPTTVGSVLTAVG